MSLLNLTRVQTIALSLLLLLAIAYADFLTGYTLPFNLFYLAPIALAAWNIGRNAAIPLGILCATAGFIGDRLAGAPADEALRQLWGLAISLGFFVIVALLLDRLRSAMTVEHELARTDPLTMIANARAFGEIAALDLERSRRYNRPITAIYIDCDDFKRLNDGRGHREGNAVLREVAQTLRGHLRTSDTAARVGGDEFVVLLGESRADSAQITARRLRAALLNAMQQHDWPITFSIGVATFEVAPGTVEALLERADKLMYQAKDQGRDRIVAEVVSE